MSSGCPPGGGAGRGEAGGRSPALRADKIPAPRGRVAVVGSCGPLRVGRQHPPLPATLPPAPGADEYCWQVVPGGLEPGGAGERGREAGDGAEAASGSRLKGAALPRLAMPAPQGRSS